MPSKKETDAGEVAGGKDIAMDELGAPGPIEKVAESHFKEEAEIAAFMEEKVQVMVPVDGTPGALPVVVITVNGKNQPIIRGRAQLVRRKYIEAMARSRITHYEQEVPDPTKPDMLQLKDMTQLTYPFSVIGDHEIGAEWLNAILNQPM